MGVPLFGQEHVEYLVVASNGGGDTPGWFLNLQEDPTVGLQVKAEHHIARARIATAEEKPELWRIMTRPGHPTTTSRPWPTESSPWCYSSRPRLLARIVHEAG
jgi:deazaflavin-dependent oxidoreductase (nitroreductase family)